MGIPVIIYGRSGSGKSRSLKNFAEDEILYVNVEKKMLPFKGKFKYTLNTEDPNLIVDQLKKMPCKAAVIDDSTYIMVNQFMRRRRANKGGNQFDLYNDIADYIWNLFEVTRKDLPEDTIVYIVMHEETNDYGNTKIRTIGKLLDDKVQPEGIVTICLRCIIDNGKHFFLTKSDGTDPTKSPEDLFEERIPNDLKAVDSRIREYYGIGTEYEKA